MINMEFLESILFDGFFATIAAIGFSVISNPPRRAILYAALLAAIGHSIRFTLMHFSIDLTTASFISSFCIGLLSIFMGKHIHCPATVLYIPALLPMIPGMYAYRTILSLIQFLQSTDDGMTIKYLLGIFKNGLTTLTVLFVLAVGATMPLFIFYKRAFEMTRNASPANQKKKNR